MTLNGFGWTKEEYKRFDPRLKRVEDIVSQFRATKERRNRDRNGWEWEDVTLPGGAVEVDAICRVFHYKPRKQEVEVKAYNFIENGGVCPCEIQQFEPRILCKHGSERMRRAKCRKLGLEPDSEEGIQVEV